MGASRIRLSGLLSLVILSGILHGCAGGLKTGNQPMEQTAPPSIAQQWQALEQVRSDDGFHVLNSGNEALEWRLRAIDSALESIDMQTFIWKLDDVGKLVLKHLLAAADRGVTVRILVDDSFTAGEDQALLDIDHHPGVQLRIYNPYEQRSSHMNMRMLLNIGDFGRLDHRMHNKVLVVDGRAAIIGGRNTAEEYFGYHDSDNFRDMEVVAVGPVVQKLFGAFDDYWNAPFSVPVEALHEGYTKIRELALSHDALSWYVEQSAQQRLDSWISLTRAAHSGKAQLFIDQPAQINPVKEAESAQILGRELLEVIENASSEVWLISAYLIPTQNLEDAIERLLDRGVRLRILTNSINSNNHLSAHSAYRNHVTRLVEMGVEVYELRHDARDRQRYIDSPVDAKSLCLHAKIILVDQNLVFIGSPNLDSRSLRINTEMGLLIDSESLNRQMKREFTTDFDPRNAWELRFDENRRLTWVSDDEVLHHQPTHSYMRRLEDWFLSHLPLEGEM